MHGYNEMDLSEKTMKFTAYRSGVQVLGCDKYGHVGQMYLILKNVFSTLIHVILYSSNI